MPTEIPLRQRLPAWRQVTALDGAAYTWAFRWNVRAARWTLDLYTADGTQALALGVPLVLQWDLLRTHRAREPRLPAGLLVAVTVDGSSAPPAYDELGVRVRLYHYTDAEAAALASTLAPPNITIEAAP